MGEKLRDITILHLHDMDVNIELNDGNAATRAYKTIHIQNDRFRLQLKEKEYMQMAMAIRVAADKIRSSKDLSTMVKPDGSDN